MPTCKYLQIFPVEFHGLLSLAEEFRERSSTTKDKATFVGTKIASVSAAPRSDGKIPELDGLHRTHYQEKKLFSPGEIRQ